MIIEEEGPAANVTDNLRDTYHHIAGQGFNGYLYEPPGEHHGGVVDHTDPTKDHRAAVEMYAKHIKDHGGEDVRAYIGHNADPEKRSSTLLMYKDGGATKLANITSSSSGRHRLELGYGGW